MMSNTVSSVLPRILFLPQYNILQRTLSVQYRHFKYSSDNYNSSRKESIAYGLGEAHNMKRKLPLKIRDAGKFQPLRTGKKIRIHRYMFLLLLN